MYLFSAGSDEVEPADVF
jgi:hypothetical protein